MPTKTVSQPRNKAETPFAEPVWPWNQPPLAGNPSRQRCQSVVSEDEATTGTELIAHYRSQEALAATHDIDARAVQFEKPFPPKGVAAELLRREMAACNHEVFLAAQADLAKLRQEAFELVKPIIKRLVKSLADELNDAALSAEQRLDAAGLPVRSGASWLLYDDPLIKALWSCRGKAEVLLTELSVENSIGCVQFFLTTGTYTVHLVNNFCSPCRKPGLGSPGPGSSSRAHLTLA
jgi:hypothetical protein